MVTFLPFPGLRPNVDSNDIENRISPPYDVIGDDYLKELQSKKNNVTRLTLMPDDNGRYSNSRKELESWIKENALISDDDSFYLYRQSFSDSGKEYVRTGLIGILKTEPYENGHVIPHEETFSKVKEDRLNLLRDMETHLESIFGIYEGFPENMMKDVLNSAVPLYVYSDSDGVRHEIMRISDENITKRISKELEKQKMLIADGHHRYETALNYSNENPGDKKRSFVLATLVSADDAGLVVWPTHRLLRSSVIPENEAIEKISEKLEMKEVSKDEMLSKLKDHMFGLAFKSGRCFLCDHSDDSDPLWSLDTYVAQELILKGVYGYDEGNVTVAYDAEMGSTMKKMSLKEYDLAIVLNDPSLKGIWDLSMIGKRMPKKTTFFYPKIWSGFVFYRMV